MDWAHDSTWSAGPPPHGEACMGNGDDDIQKTVQQRLTEAQRQRNELIARGVAHLVAPSVRHYDEANGSVWRTTTKIHTVVRSAAADACVTLSVSPFRGRKPTIVFLPLDHPWDGDLHSNDNSAYVEPLPLAWLPPARMGEQKKLRRERAYAALHFTMSDNAVRFFKCYVYFGASRFCGGEKSPIDNVVLEVVQAPCKKRFFATETVSAYQSLPRNVAYWQER
ncbi:putative tubulin-tyrosine ligase [Trypanosoma cruzi]|uniref:Putative tubulin-tyrosine ligase n=1 Tax=Trypanosoma cruzi TaxID=5693 RepID=A0A2V2WJG0_TRYCR|nr:putative tubulin-tyrosine ligase [Trypanosoma cruzi]